MTYSALPMIAPSLPVLSEVPSEAFPRPLSQILRVSTELAHKEVEVRLGLPGFILFPSDYQDCLLRFYQLYRPLETRFESFADWTGIGLDPPSRSLSTRLAADLRTLGVLVPDIRDAPAASLPRLETFAHALGACYVIEGSALGSQFILPQLQQVLGEGMTGADNFFRGRGSETGAFWRTFRAALDLFGDTHPEHIANTVSSAIATFKAIGLWMRP